MLLAELVDAVLGEGPEVLRCIQRVCARVIWSPALKQEVYENLDQLFIRRGIMHLLTGTIDATLGALESRNPSKLITASGPAKRDGHSLPDVGLTDGHKKYVEVGDRHLFVLMRNEGAALLVTEDRKILSGRDKLSPYRVDDRAGFLEANGAPR